MCFVTPQQETSLARPRPVFRARGAPFPGFGCASARSASPRRGGGGGRDKLQKDFYTPSRCCVCAESAATLQLTCKLKNPWNDNLFGFELLNEMRSVTIDGWPVSVRDVFGRYWNQQQYLGELKSLNPSLPANTSSAARSKVPWYLCPTWRDSPKMRPPKTGRPPSAGGSGTAKREFMVYANDVEIVSLTNDLALEPVVNGALSVKQIIIRRKGDHLTAVASFNLDPQPGLPVSVDVSLRLAREDFNCGRLFGEKSPGRRTYSPKELTADIGPLDPQIKEGEIRLLPDPKAVEAYPGVDRIWGKEIDISHVPLLRQDLPR